MNLATKRRILTLSLLIAVVGVASWLLLRPEPEPVYQGKPLTYWCEQYIATYGPNSQGKSRAQVEIAIRAIGTNAIPTLLRWLKTDEDSKLKVKLLQLASKQHVLNIRWKTAEIQHREARIGLRCLGPLAKSALPTLIEMYNRHGSDPFDSPDVIAEISGSVGPTVVDAVPGLIIDTTNRRPDIRWRAVQALGQIGARPDLVVPALTKCLGDSSEDVRVNAAFGLEASGNDAKSAVPELISLLADPSSDVRDQAASALKQIDPEAAAKAGVK
jgi:hypothetical protein